MSASTVRIISEKSDFAAADISIGSVQVRVRTGDAARNFKEVLGSMRHEILKTMEYLTREAQREMAARAPHRGGTLNLPQRIGRNIVERDTMIRGVVRPRGSTRVKLAAYTLEGGFSGTVKQHVRRPPGAKARQQGSIRTRLRFARKGGTLVRVADYTRSQAAQPFVRPVFESMAEVAQKALENAVARAAREAT